MDVSVLSVAVYTDGRISAISRQSIQMEVSV